MISIIIPAYNYAHFLPDAIRSVMNQGVLDIEIVVCDDCSTDNTFEVVESLNSEFPSVIRYIHHDKNLGAIPNINFGVKQARGQYVLLLGADDVLSPFSLQILLDVLVKNADIDYVYGRYNFLDEQGGIHPLQHPGWLDKDYIGTRDEFPSLLKFDCYINIGATLFRTSLFSSRDFFDETLSVLPEERFFRATDWDLELSLSLEGKRSAYVDKVISYFRVHSSQASSNDKYALSGLAILEHGKLIEKYVNDENFGRYKSDFDGIKKLFLSKYEYFKVNTPVDVDRYDLVSGFSDSIVEILNSIDLKVKSEVNNERKISVIIPTKNRPGLLANALESLCYQTFKDFEVVIHNDGGCDVGDIIAFYQDRLRIVYLRSPRSGGAAASRNKALKLASGSIITYLDDDDVYLDNHLQLVFDALTDSNQDFVYTASEYLVQERKNGRLIELGREKAYDGITYAREKLLVQNFIPTPTWAHKRSLFEKAGGFNEQLTILEDWEFLLRCSQLTHFKKINHVTVEVRSDVTRADHTLKSNQNLLLETHQHIYDLYPVEDSDLLKARQRFIGDLKRKQAGEAPLDYVYDQWVDARHPNELTAQIHAERMMLKWSKQWSFNLLMVVKEADLPALAQTIDSLCEQLYGNWRLIVISDLPVPDESFENNETLGWLTIDQLGEEDIAAALNGVMDAIPSDWIALMLPGAKLTSTALLQVGDRLLKNAGACVIYSDHDHYTPEGVRIKPILKPDFSLDLIRSEDYVDQCVFFRAEQVNTAGGFHAFPGAMNYELLLRIHDMFGAGCIEHVPDVIISLPDEQVEDKIQYASMQVALENHLTRNHVKAEVLSGYVDGTFQVNYLHETKPLVSVIIPNKNMLEFFQPCVDSLFTKTENQSFELIIVDNQSTDPDLFAYYQSLQSQYGKRVQIVNYDAPFNFAEQCNRGSQVANGEYLLLLNNDTEIIQGQWLDRMLEHAQREEVGVVGAKLLFPETATLQHAGVVLWSGAPDFIANHIHLNRLVSDDLPMNRTKVVQNFSAVTGACLMIGKALYQAVNGMDATNFAILFNDVDLCLRIQQLGKSVVWTPFATVVHHAHKSLHSNQDFELLLRKKQQTEIEKDAFFHKWLPLMNADKYYHRLLDPENVGADIDVNYAPKWDDIPSSRPRVLALPLGGGSGEYRVNIPLRSLDVAAIAEVDSKVVNIKKRLPSLSDIAKGQPDTFIVQNALATDYEILLEKLGKYLPKVFRVQMLDDLLSDIPKESSMHQHFQKHWRDAKTRLRNTLKHCDRLIVTTQPLKEFAADMIDDIVVMPNMLEKSVWGHLISNRGTSSKPRVGWVGAQQHAGDLSLIIDVVKATYKEVDWVFQGMCPDELKQYVAESNTDWLTYNVYPETIAKLNLDLAIAPLEVNSFNEAKSNLRLLEYGALGWPVICTDIYPYRENNAPVCRVPNDAESWIAAIREHISDLALIAKKGDELKAWVHQHYMIEDHANEWLAALSR